MGCFYIELIFDLNTVVLQSKEEQGEGDGVGELDPGGGPVLLGGGTESKKRDEESAGNECVTGEEAYDHEYADDEFYKGETDEESPGKTDGQGRVGKTGGCFICESADSGENAGEAVHEHVDAESYT